jgi:predicted DNA-binding transcriptional regulator AlpA
MKRHAAAIREVHPNPDIQKQRTEIMAQFYVESDILALLGGVCKKTFDRMVKRGEFTVPKTVLPGRIVVYKKTLVNEWYRDEFIASRTTRPVRRRRNGRAS